MRQSLITEYFVPIGHKIKNFRKIKDIWKIKDIEEYDKKQKNILLVYGYDLKTDSWHCLECGDDMGKFNPRQLCGKTHCLNKY